MSWFSRLLIIAGIIIAILLVYVVIEHSIGSNHSDEEICAHARDVCIHGWTNPMITSNCLKAQECERMGK